MHLEEGVEVLPRVSVVNGPCLIRDEAKLKENGLELLLGNLDRLDRQIDSIHNIIAAISVQLKILNLLENVDLLLSSVCYFSIVPSAARISHF